jgi:hypothetical protein
MDTSEMPPRKPYAPPKMIVSEAKNAAVTSKNTPTTHDQITGTLRFGKPLAS